MLQTSVRAPLHERLRQQLNEQISAGRWRPGDRIPPERELAKTYGVSLITVRRALHDLATEGVLVRRVPAGTFVAVRATRLRQLGIVSFGYQTMTNRLFGPMLGGMQHAAERRASLHLLTAPAGVEKGNWLKQVATEGNLDGIIVVTTDPVRYEDVAPLELIQFPYVLLNRRVPGHDVWCAVLNDYELAAQATDYLYEKGHHCLAHIAGPATLVTAVDRLRGFLDGLRRHGLLSAREKNAAETLPDGAPVIRGEFSYGDEVEDETGYAAMRELLNRSPRPTAVFAAADNLAAGAYRAIKEAGLRIPEDVSVIGVTNEPFAALLDPPLTTFGYRRREMGRQTVHSLLQQIEGLPLSSGAPWVEITGRMRIVRSNLIERASCAPPAR